MTFKFISLILFMLLVLLPILSIEAEGLPSSKKPKPFEFLKHLQGCHKGDTVKGVHDLKEYLKKFGYLNYDGSNNTHSDDDNFDEFLESAVKTYQINYNLKTTGSLDADTVNKMIIPRCGVADIINGTTTMRSEKTKHHRHTSTSLHTVSHYSFFDGSPRWPDSKSHLTYAFHSATNRNILSPICARAFSRWSSVSHFTFEEIQDFNTADIRIGFHKMDHGDGNPFDGPGGTLAHAYAPTNGRFHYDADENWATEPITGSYDLYTIALHEIGHLLGLHHSSVEGAIMYPSIAAGVRKELHGDDVQGIRALYNL